MTELETLQQVLRDELSYLWHDLHDARLAAFKDGWSIQCRVLEERIKTITPLVGPTPWEEIGPGVELIEAGIYQRIHAELGVEAPIDMDRVRAHRARIDEGART